MTFDPGVLYVHTCVYMYMKEATLGRITVDIETSVM